ncbi:MAG: DUF4190 domain-containing protein [Marmoricola sp.]
MSDQPPPYDPNAEQPATPAPVPPAPPAYGAPAAPPNPYGSPTYPAAPGYPAPGAPTGGFAPAQENSTKATVALVLGIVSFVFCGPFTSVPGFFVGRSAVKEIDASGGRLSGRGLATAGWIISLINIILVILAVILFGVIIATTDCQDTSSGDSYSFNCS